MSGKNNEAAGAKANTPSNAQSQNSPIAPSSVGTAQDLNAGLLDEYVGADSAGGPAENQPAPAGVSIEQFEALQQQLAAQKAQFDQLLKIVTEKNKLDEEELGKETIPSAIQMATWFMNDHGVTMPATPLLKARYKKLGLHPCDAPAGYEKKKKAR